MDTKAILVRRLDIFTEMLGFDRGKMRAWSFAQTVLATIWLLDVKSNDWQHFMKCAEVMNEL